MGNSASSSGRGHHEESVDCGRLIPQGIYTGPKDYNQQIVSQLICERKLAPFYRPLEEYDDTWDDDQILAARKELPESDSNHPETTSITRTDSNNAAGHKHGKRPGMIKESSRNPDAGLYRGAVECPICFLYYPPNINHSRCCDQAICTECFVQIKRTEPTTTHAVSEPAACPYCVQDNFGIVYTPPHWRTGIGSGGGLHTPPWIDSPKGPQNSLDPSPHFTSHKRRQKSFGHDSPEVVTTDQIRPDWEAKLAAVRAAVARRANRRIIMRQVGDRLIPVGVTSGRVHAITPEEVQNEVSESGGGSRRSRRRQQAAQNQEFNQLLGSMGLGGQDLEELMIMEAMRLSLVEHEEHQRREAQNRQREGGSTDATATQPIPVSSASHMPDSPAPPTLTMSASSLASTPSPTPTPLNDARLLPSSTRSDVTSSTTSRWSTSRNRTPSPPPITSPAAAAHPLTDHATNWFRRASNPPPFTTLSAALGAASTASAILGNDVNREVGETPAVTGEDDVVRSEPTSPVLAVTMPTALPSIPVSDNRSYSAPQHPMSLAESFVSEDSPHPGLLSTYDVLLSSPESDFSHEPLLGNARSSWDQSRSNSISEPDGRT